MFDRLQVAWRVFTGKKILLISTHPAEKQSVHISHNMSDAEIVRYCTSIALMKQGGLSAMQEVNEILNIKP